MAETIRFTSNYEDLSTETGFQFEFKCERCGAGYRSSFKGYAIGSAANVLETAGSIFGGFLSGASDAANRINEEKYQQAHDDAFLKAIREIEPKFVQCSHCNAWVCREKCWNEKKGLCKNCAPDLGVEMAAAQASKSREEIWAHAAMAEEDKKLGAEHWRHGIVATCPACEKPLGKNSKFCPECGHKLNDPSQCKSCGVKIEKNTKFCPECGEKV